MGRNFGGLRPLWGGRSGVPIQHKVAWAEAQLYIPSYMLIHAAIWPQQIWAENWGLCPFGEGGAGSPSKTMWPGPRPTCLPSFILIRPTVWPQYTNVTDRQTGQRTDSIGRTVLETVAQPEVHIIKLRFYVPLDAKQVILEMFFSANLSNKTRAQQLLRSATIWPQQTWAKKWWMLFPFLWWNWVHILIHPAVWPQYTNVTDRQDRTTVW